MSSPLWKRVADTSGQSLVEFSLVALLSVMLLFGAFEMCRMVLVYTTIANAARAGARYAIVNGSDVNTTAALGPLVQQVVKSYLSTGTINTSSAGLNVPLPAYPDGDDLPGHRVTVTVSYVYDPFVGYFPLTGISLSSTSQGVFTY